MDTKLIKSMATEMNDAELQEFTEILIAEQASRLPESLAGSSDEA